MGHETPLVFFTVPGVRTPPNSDKNWTGKMVSAILRRAPELQRDFGASAVAAEKVEYHTLAAFRWLSHKSRVHRLRRTMDQYPGWRIRIVAHSNGANIVLDALRESNWAHAVEMVDLISPACESDLSYLAPRLGKELKMLRVWIAQKDLPLKFAATPIGRLLGYGSLGKDGIKGIPHTKKKHTATLYRKTFGHSSWFLDEHFDETVEKILLDRWPSA